MMPRTAVSLAAGSRAIWAALWLGLWLCSQRASALEWSSGFDFDLEGWTGTHGTLAHVPAGGNPGGFLAQTDTDDDFMQVFAPPVLSGDLSAFLGGTVSFDGLNVNGEAPDSPDLPQFGTVIFSGSAGVASLLLGGVGNPVADRAWHTYSASISSGEPFLAAVLADVTQITLILESHTGVSEVIGVDNFRLVAIPEPGMLSLALMGGCLMAGLAWRTRRMV